MYVAAKTLGINVDGVPITIIGPAGSVELFVTPAI